MSDLQAKSTNTLALCPFCGGEADVIDYDDECWVAHQCANGTSVETNSYATEAEAIAAWNTRVDYNGYEQAAIEAWESIKAWNSRAERTCRSTTDDSAWCFVCSECGKSFPRSKLHLAHNHGEINYCPNCGRRCI